MAQPKISVSQSYGDDVVASWLVDYLRTAGADAWLDKTDLAPATSKSALAKYWATARGLTWY